MNPSIVQAILDNDSIRNLIEQELRILRYLNDEQTKDDIRAFHIGAVQLELKKGQKWIKQNYKKYENFFANGTDLDPQRIEPILYEVKERWQEDLFRLARYTWSLPYTKGYGRRLRFLILDGTNEKLIGIFGLQSPPLDFPARDGLFNYPPKKKIELVNQTMDIFTLGAIPPYNKLLAGKLVGLAVISNEVQNVYTKKYTDRLTELDKRYLPPNLVCLTTTSAFGRSSIYNRLKYNDRVIAQSIGYTQGYGSFHLSVFYPIIKSYLKERGISTKGGFGVGPRIIWQSFMRAQKELGLPKDLLKHGVKREVFLFPLISNLKEYMDGNDKSPKFFDQSFSDLASWWKQRWLSPKLDTNNGWHDWDKDEIRRMLFLGDEPNNAKQ